MTQRRDHAKVDERRGSLIVYPQLALGMATFGSATPASKIVTAAMPVFIGSALRVGLGALVLAPSSRAAGIKLGNSSGATGCASR